MKHKTINKMMAAALLGTICAGMAVGVSAEDAEKVTLSVINYHVGTDYAQNIIPICLCIPADRGR